MLSSTAPAEVFRNVEKLREVGLDVPLAASLAHRLRDRGIPVGEDILNTSDLRAALSAAVDPSLKLMQPDVAPDPRAEGLRPHLPGRHPEGERGGKDVSFRIIAASAWG